MTQSKQVQPADSFAAEFSELLEASQVTMASLARETGYTWNTIWSWKHNRRVPNFGTQRYVLGILREKAAVVEAKRVEHEQLLARNRAETLKRFRP